MRWVSLRTNETFNIYHQTNGTPEVWRANKELPVSSLRGLADKVFPRGCHLFTLRFTSGFFERTGLQFPFLIRVTTIRDTQYTNAMPFAFLISRESVQNAGNVLFHGTFCINSLLSDSKLLYFFRERSEYINCFSIYLFYLLVSCTNAAFGV